MTGPSHHSRGAASVPLRPFCRAGEDVVDVRLIRQFPSGSLFPESIEHIGPDPDRDHLLGDTADGRAPHAPGGAKFRIGEFRDVRKINITIRWLVRRAAWSTTGARGGSSAAS
jgi:hypothetical protein